MAVVVLHSTKTVAAILLNWQSEVARATDLSRLTLFQIQSYICRYTNIYTRTYIIIKIYMCSMLKTNERYTSNQ